MPLRPMPVTARYRRRFRHGRFWGPPREYPRHAAGDGPAINPREPLPALHDAPAGRIPDHRAPPAPLATGPAIPGDAGRGRGRGRLGGYKGMSSSECPRSRAECRTPALTNDNSDLTGPLPSGGSLAAAQGMDGERGPTD